MQHNQRCSPKQQTPNSKWLKHAYVLPQIRDSPGASGHAGASPEGCCAACCCCFCCCASCAAAAPAAGRARVGRPAWPCSLVGLLMGVPTLCSSPSKCADTARVLHKGGVTGGSGAV